MFATYQPSPYDLSFRIFGIPVRVHPSFWLVSAIFAFPFAALGVQFWFLAVACVFVLLMVHELGHALMFRAYHMPSFIVLYSFGGFAAPESVLPRRSWRIIVSLAGPLANFLLAAIVWGTNETEKWRFTNDYTLVIFMYFFWISLYLGLLNLLPVWPLDGGKISRELWMQAQPRNGLINSLRLSIVVAIAFSIYGFGCHYGLIPRDWIVDWLRPGIFAAIFFALFAVENFQELQIHQQQNRYFGSDDRLPWER